MCFVMGFVRTATLAVVAMALLSACGTTPAPDFRGRWREVNTIDAEPRAIPLRPLHAFVVLPSDRTLRDVLDRWGRESNRRVAYRAPMNYSVHLQATKVTAASLDAALGQLASAYAAQGIGISLDGDSIVVSSVGGVQAEPAAGAKS
jgi:predicted membrane-bound mannosyltransferase